MYFVEHPKSVIVVFFFSFSTADPTEHNNVAGEYPNVLESLKRRIEVLKKDMVPADDPPDEKRGDPKFWNGNFSPGWCVAH